MMLILQSFNTISSGSSSPGFPGNRSHKLQVSVVYDFNRNWSAQIGAFTAIAGKNALLERGLVAGVWHRF